MPIGTLCASVRSHASEYHTYQGPTWRGTVLLTCLLTAMGTSVNAEGARSRCSQPYQQYILGKRPSTLCQGTCSNVENRTTTLLQCWADCCTALLYLQGFLASELVEGANSDTWKVREEGFRNLDITSQDLFAKPILGPVAVYDKHALCYCQSAWQISLLWRSTQHAQSRSKTYNSILPAGRKIWKD